MHGARGHARRSRRHGTAALLFLVAASVCGGEPERASSGQASAPAAPADPGSAPPTASEDPADTTGGAPAPTDSTAWSRGLTSAPTSIPGGTAPVPVLTDLRTGVHAEYERVTIELEAEGGLPGYRVEYVDRPLHDCGSGEPTYPVGDAWLEIRLEPAAAHTEEGRPTLGPREVRLDAPLLRRIYRTCDFEAVVTHVLALSAPNEFRVITLSDPPRIAVDVRR